MSAEDGNAETTAAHPLPSDGAAPEHPDQGVRATRRARRIGGHPANVKPKTDPADLPDPGEPSAADTDAPAVRPGRSATRVAADRQAHALSGTEPVQDEPPTVNLAKAPKQKRIRPARVRNTRPTPAGPPAGRSPRRRLAWTAAAVAVAAALVLGTFSVTSSHRVWWGKSSPNVTADRTEVLAAAKSCIAKLNTYDYRTLDTAEAAGLSCTTGAFTGQYKQAFDTQIKQLAPTVKATQAFQVNAAGIERVSTDRTQWDVLVFGQIATTNSTTAASSPKLSLLSAVVHMQRVGSQWLVAGYTYAPPN